MGGRTPSVSDCCRHRRDCSVGREAAANRDDRGIASRGRSGSSVSRRTRAFEPADEERHRRSELKRHRVRRSSGSRGRLYEPFSQGPVAVDRQGHGAGPFRKERRSLCRSALSRRWLGFSASALLPCAEQRANDRQRGGDHQRDRPPGEIGVRKGVGDEPRRHCRWNESPGRQVSCSPAPQTSHSVESYGLVTEDGKPTSAVRDLRIELVAVAQRRGSDSEVR